MDEPKAWCELCVPRRKVLVSELASHMKKEHDLDISIATWPDGEPVVINKDISMGDLNSEDI